MSLVCSPAASAGWCASGIRVPHVDWRKVVASDPTAYPSTILALGFQKFLLPDGLTVYLVESPSHVADAIARLRDSMQDPLVAIDLEWKPSFSKRQNRVAMVQLASATVAVLLRTSRMHFLLPQVGALAGRAKGWSGGVLSFLLRQHLFLWMLAACAAHERNV